jgi:uncharacterized membrane protein YhhN
MTDMPRARTVLLGAGYAALAVADSVAAGHRGTTTARRLRLVLKPALMPVLAAAFLDGTRGDPRPVPTDLLRAGTVAAQALSWGGDLALLGSSRRSFLAGVGSFAGAHVAYVAAFLSVRGSPRGEGRIHDTAGLRVALGLWVSAAPLLSVAAGRRDPALRVPVAAYATVLSGMFATSRLVDPTLPPVPRRTLQAGTALFLVSDTVLAVQQFVLTEPRPLLESVVMLTYTAGQGLIAAGVAGLTAC